MLYTFYGDDFTGSTDVLEQLASAGVTTVLFLKPPTLQQLAEFGEVQAVGLAGDSRSRSPQWMRDHLPKIFAALKKFHAPINHYKVCSTFDSSSTIGSIGCAIEVGREIFSPEFVPVLVAATHLQRYMVFGNLFAADPKGTVQRIDRHPMASHPATPMHEADLRRHLGTQTQLPIGLVNLIALQEGREAIELKHQLEQGAFIVLFDGMSEGDLAAAGTLLWERAQQRPIFSASSSGMTAALLSAWKRSGAIKRAPVARKIGSENSPLLVLSGSCSPATAIQIRWALENGFHGIAADPEALVDPEGQELARVREQVMTNLAADRNTVVFTALGNRSEIAIGDSLGVVFGSLLRELVLSAGVRRALLCGGDTSSHAVQQLGIYALTWLRPVQAGAPLCKAHSEQSALHGLELVLKGGQVGSPDFFNVVQRT
jgi:uncharacterized protein YgbK (DUF1537 family)